SCALQNCFGHTPGAIFPNFHGVRAVMPIRRLRIGQTWGLSGVSLGFIKFQGTFGMKVPRSELLRITQIGSDWDERLADNSAAGREEAGLSLRAGPPTMGHNIS